MPPTYAPAIKCDAYVPHCARTVFLACCAGNVPHTIVIWVGGPHQVRCFISHWVLAGSSHQGPILTL